MRKLRRLKKLLLKMRNKFSLGNRKYIYLIMLILVSSIVFSIPNSINIQGKLTNPSGIIQTGTFNFTFRIYDGYTGGNKLYEKANLTTSTDARGIYDIILNNVNISFDKQLYLGVEVNANGEMSPRVNLTSVPYSFRANTSDELDVNRSYTVLGLNVTENITLGDKITFRLRESIDNLVDGFLRISGSVNVTESLIVLGGINVSGDLSVNTEINLTSLGSIFASGTVSAGTVSAISQLNVGGGFDSGGLTVGSDGTITTQGDILFSGNITILRINHLNVNGSINPRVSDTFDLGNGTFRWRNANFSGLVEVGSLIAAGVNVSGDLNVLGKVGIGTTSPNQKLVVVGTVNITQGLNVTGGIRVSGVSSCTGDIESDSEGNFFCGTDQTGTVTPGTNLNVTQLNSSGQTLLATGSGNVGIGTISPTEKLVIMGNLSVNNTDHGSVALFVDSTNNLTGIGTTNPNERLEVKGGNISIVPSGDPPNSGEVVSLKFSGAENPGGFPNRHAKISLFNTGGEDQNELAFFTGFASTITEVMRLDDQGNVGIGTTSPDSELHVIGGLCVEASDTGCSSADGTIRADTYDNLPSLDNSTLWANTTTNVYLADSTKNVGIGDTSPNAKLHVVTTAETNVHYDNFADIIIEDAESRLQIIADDGGNQASGIILTNSPSSGGNKHWVLQQKGTSSSNDFRIGYGTSASTGQDTLATVTDYLTIKNDTGNVGIGTTGPLSTLHVNGSGANAGFRVSNETNTTFFVNASSGKVGIGTSSPAAGAQLNIDETDTSALAQLRIDQRGTGDVGLIMAVTGVQSYSLGIDNDDSDKLKIDLGAAGIGSNTLMTIQSDGNVGIGTTSPGMKLVVAGNVNISQNLTVNNSVFFVDGTSGRVGIGTTSPNALLSMEVAGSSANAPLLEWRENGAPALEFLWTGDFAGTGPTGNGIKFNATWTDNILYLRGDGNVGIGTTSPTSNLEIESSENTSILISSTTINTNASLILLENDGTRGVVLVYDGFNAPGGGGELHIKDFTGDSIAVFGRDGNVGIGTASPDVKFVVQDNSLAGFGSQLRTNTSSLTGGSGHEISFWFDNTGAFRRAGRIALAVDDGGQGADDPKTSIHFFNIISGIENETMTIDKNGAVTIANLKGEGNTYVCTDDNGLFFVRTDDTCTSSAQRYKENITDFTLDLNKFLRNRVRYFNWKINGEHDIGMVAEEVYQNNPELVFLENGKIEGIKNNDVMWYLFETVKELKANSEKQQKDFNTSLALLTQSNDAKDLVIDDLTKRISALESK